MNNSNAVTGMGCASMSTPTSPIRVNHLVNEKQPGTSMSGLGAEDFKMAINTVILPQGQSVVKKQGTQSKSKLQVRRYSMFLHDKEDDEEKQVVHSQQFNMQNNMQAS